MSSTILFSDRFIEAALDKGTPCTVGLDPVVAQMPREFLSEHGHSEHSSAEQLSQLLYLYNQFVLDAVHDLIPAVKPQIAFYERYGSCGIAALERTIEYAKKLGLLIILDAKRGDIGSTSQAYADAYLRRRAPHAVDVDCLTVQPYLGADSLEPFVEACDESGNGLFVCVRTSNLGAALIQDVLAGDQPVYEKVADMVAQWSNRCVGKHGYSSIGAVVGATCPAQAARLREKLPSCLFLVPGFGAQKGSREGIRRCFNLDGRGAVVSSSRAIMYPRLFGSADLRPNTSVRVALQHFIKEVEECRPR